MKKKLNVSEVLIKDVWPKLCGLGVEELRINGKTAWSDNVMDVMYGREDYSDLVSDYLKRAEKALYEDYSNFRVTNINITIIDFHHCVADITGYYE